MSLLCHVCAAGSSGKSVPLSPGAQLSSPQTRVAVTEGKAAEDPPSFAHFLLCLEESVSCSATKGDIGGTSAAFCLGRGSVETRPDEKTVECTLDPLIFS